MQHPKSILQNTTDDDNSKIVTGTGETRAIALINADEKIADVRAIILRIEHSEENGVHTCIIKYRKPWLIK